MSWVPLSSLCSLQHSRASGVHKLLSLEERRRIIKEEEALQQEGVEEEGEEGESSLHPLLNSLLNPIQRTYSKNVTSLVILAISDANGEFLLD